MVRAALIDTPADLVWDARIATFLDHAVARRPLPARPLLQPARGPPPLRPAEPRQLRRDRALRGSRRAADPARRRPRAARGADDPRHGAAPWAAALLAAARAARSSACSASTSRAPGCATSSASAGATSSSTSRTRWSSPPTSSSSGSCSGPSEAAFYAIASRLFQLVFGLASVVTSLLYPAFAEYEGSGEQERQRRLLLSGLRGGSAAALVLALPLLVIPANLIHAWVGDGFSESAPVLALLALVLLVHQPVWMLTQYLIARGRQREIAQAADRRGGGEPRSVGRAGAHRRHVGRRARDAARRRRRARRRGPALGRAGCRTARGRALARAAAAGAAGARPRGARSSASPAASAPTRSSSCSPSASPGRVLASAAVWRLGLTADERRSFSRQIGRGGAQRAASARGDLAAGHVFVDRERCARSSARPRTRSGRVRARPRRARLRGRGRRAALRAPRPGPRRRRARRAVPVSPSATTSGTALTRVATTGRPASIASSSTIPKPSQRDVCTKTSARSSQSRMSVRPGRVTASSSPSSATSCRVSASSGPLPRMARRASGTRRANARERRAAASRGPSARSAGRRRARAARPPGSPRRRASAPTARSGSSSSP